MGTMARDLAFLTALASPLTAQCTTTAVTDFDGVPGINGGAFHLQVHGSPPQLLMTGLFDYVGDVAAQDRAQQDLTTGVWQPLSLGGYSQTVSGPFDRMSNGDLVCRNPAGTGTLATWDGTSWTPLAGLTNTGKFHVSPSGVLHSLGYSTAGYDIHVWSGTAWSPLGITPQLAAGSQSWEQLQVDEFGVRQDGTLAIIGRFSVAGGTYRLDIAIWDGLNVTSTTSSTGFNLTPRSVFETPGGELLTYGRFTALDGQSFGKIARFDGASWQPIGAGFSGEPISHHVSPTGDAYLFGQFETFDTISVKNLVRYDGTAWHALGTGVGSGGVPGVTSVNAMATLPGGDLLVGGSFYRAGSADVQNLALWDGLSWRPAIESPHPNAAVLGLHELATGDLLATGEFLNSGTRIARFDGTDWHDLGAGLDGVAREAINLPNGDLVVRGDFTRSGALITGPIARWDGSAWHAFGAGAPFSTIDAMVVLPDGRLVVAGGQSFQINGLALANIAIWDGSTWSEDPTLRVEGTFASNTAMVHRMTILPEGDLLLLGKFSLSGTTLLQDVARWDGSQVHAMGQAVTSSNPNFRWRGLVPQGPSSLLAWGDAVAFDSEESMRWDGISWTPLSLPRVIDATVLPDGDLVYVSQYGSAVQRWDGASSTPVPFNGTVNAVHFHGDGTLYAAGDLGVGRISGLRTSCPPTTSDLGGGCTGSNGPCTLTVGRQPWVGGSFRAAGAGLPATSLTITVIGFGPTSLPLANVFPLALPGCVLSATPDVLDASFDLGGTKSTTIMLPDEPSLAGAQLYHQLVAFGVNAQLAASEVISSNALLLTVGLF